MLRTRDPSAATDGRLVLYSPAAVGLLPVSLALSASLADRLSRGKIQAGHGSDSWAGDCCLNDEAQH
jgi:hypothetical protein